MSFLQSFLRIFPTTCRHAHTYRERRELHGVQVMHFVCESCGHAAPAVDRTAEEHQRVVQFGDRPNTRIVRQPHVVSMGGRARRKHA